MLPSPATDVSVSSCSMAHFNSGYLHLGKCFNLWRRGGSAGADEVMGEFEFQYKGVQNDDPIKVAHTVTVQ